jgi:hypothetical protein
MEMTSTAYARLSREMKLYDYIVVADNGEEKWAFGVFDNQNEAQQFAERMNETYRGKIEYEVADLYAREELEEVK